MLLKEFPEIYINFKDVYLETRCSRICTYATILQCKCRVGEQITERDMKALIYGLVKGLISMCLLIPGKGEWLHRNRIGGRASCRWTHQIKKSSTWGEIWSEFLNSCVLNRVPLFLWARILKKYVTLPEPNASSPPFLLGCLFSQTCCYTPSLLAKVSQPACH